MRFTVLRVSLMLLSTLLAGCETAADFSGAVRDRMTAREAPRTKVYAAEPRATYEAVKPNPYVNEIRAIE
jgi:predicted small secreted protein